MLQQLARDTVEGTAAASMVAGVFGAPFVVALLASMVWTAPAVELRVPSPQGSARTAMILMPPRAESQGDDVQAEARRDDPAPDRAGEASEAGSSVASVASVTGAQDNRGAVATQYGSARRARLRPAQASSPAEPVSTSVGKASGACGEPIEGIERRGTSSYLVPRQVLAHYTGGMHALDHELRIKKHLNVGGRADGLQIGSLPCGGVLRQLGLRNGDVVHTLNGRRLNTLLQAWGATRGLRREGLVRVEISRSGQRMVLNYWVQS